MGTGLHCTSEKPILAPRHVWLTPGRPTNHRSPLSPNQLLLTLPLPGTHTDPVTLRDCSRCVSLILSFLLKSSPWPAGCSHVSSSLSPPNLALHTEEALASLPDVHRGFPPALLGLSPSCIHSTSFGDAAVGLGSCAVPRSQEAATQRGKAESWERSAAGFLEGKKEERECEERTGQGVGSASRRGRRTG